VRAHEDEAKAGALQSLYSNYEKYFKQWQQNSEARAKDLTPPVS